jgi:hypothetical protein
MWYDPLIKLMLRSPLHGIASSSILLLTYTGRKSGRRFSVPVSYVWDGNDVLIVTFHRRTWWRSLQGGVPVTVRLKGRDLLAMAEASTDPEVVQRDFATYLKKTPYLERVLKVETDDDDNYLPESLARVSEGRIIVRVRFPEV